MQVRERNPVGNTTGKVRNRGHRIKWRVFSNSHYVRSKDVLSWDVFVMVVRDLSEGV